MLTERQRSGLINWTAGFLTGMAVIIAIVYAERHPHVVIRDADGNIIDPKTRPRETRQINWLTSKPLSQDEIHSFMGKDLDVVQRVVRVEENERDDNDRYVVDWETLDKGHARVRCRFAAVEIADQNSVAVLYIDDWDRCIGYMIIPHTGPIR